MLRNQRITSQTMNIVQPSVIDCKLPSPAFQTDSDTRLAPPDFIQTPQRLSKVETIQNSDDDRLSISTTSSTCSIDEEKQHDQDSIGGASGISNIFEDEVDRIAIPISAPKHKLNENMDSSDFLDCIINNENDMHPYFSKNFNENDAERFNNTSLTSNLSILNKCEQKTNLLNHIFGQAAEKLHYVEDNLPKLGAISGTASEGVKPTVTNETKCPYQKLLKEYGDKELEEFVHEAFVVFAPKI